MMAITSGEIRRRAFRLLKNSLILYFILIFINLLRSQLVSFIIFEISGFTITSYVVLNAFSLIFIIYFGYFILIDLKYFVDLISIKLEGKERGKTKSITYDIAAIISLILASQLLTPFLSTIPNIGNTMAKAINVVFLAIGFFIVYHISNEIYYLIKKHVDKLIEETYKQIKRENKTSKGGSN